MIVNNFKDQQKRKEGEKWNQTKPWGSAIPAVLNHWAAEPTKYFVFYQLIMEKILIPGFFWECSIYEDSSGQGSLREESLGGFPPFGICKD